jgi:hypothetical protein
MTGLNPTIGCLVQTDKAHFTTVEQVIQTLRSSVPIQEFHCSEAEPSSAWASLGGTMQEMIVFTQETEDKVFLHLEFDEEAVVHLARATGLSFEQLFLPYVQAAKTLPGVVAVGLGFELSPPRDLAEKSLQDAGVAVLFARDEDQKSWSRQDPLPLVGHYL